MAGTPVKLTFDLSYPDHAQAYSILRAQKQTTQFVVNLILGAAPVPTETAPAKPTPRKSNPQVTEVTAELPKSNPQVTEGTTLADIPDELLNFL